MCLGWWFVMFAGLTDVVFCVYGHCDVFGGFVVVD